MDPKTGFCHQTGTYSSIRPPIPLPPINQPLPPPNFVSPFSTAPPLTETQLSSSTQPPAQQYLTRNSFLKSVPLPTPCNNVTLYTKTTSLSFSRRLPFISPWFTSLCCRWESSFLPPIHSVPTQKSLTRSNSANPSLPSLLQKPLIKFLLLNVELSSSTLPIRHGCDINSSGTTGRVKGVMITHQNLIAIMAALHHSRMEQAEVVFLERFDFEEMLRAIEKYKVTGMPVSPPLVVAFVKSDLTKKYDLSSLQGLGSGGAPLGKDVSERFKAKFPNVLLVQEDNKDDIDKDKHNWQGRYG
ncbi:hypothetical protein F3Y22_tig00111071pilonHSYRG00008 [Hibiscus syriacus]|uniref:AMP-dependent synthetase/ligase domain-containing protein n=1 Tax=Hibiscus syriacus TaxID=106335 RepID=A0A6A2Z551_HIBSY|nr:hypothetical protein F3Y22_tig00111071pilonHSYRG00008 [Hibiscus syriacus]